MFKLNTTVLKLRFTHCTYIISTEFISFIKVTKYNLFQQTISHQSQMVNQFFTYIIIFIEIWSDIYYTFSQMTN